MMLVGIAALVTIGWVGSWLELVTDSRRFTSFLFMRDDLRMAIAIAILCRFAIRPGPVTIHPWMDWIGERPWLVALALTLVSWTGHHLVFGGRDFTRDEQMALFDGAIYADGRLAWPLPAEWRPLIKALNDTFILPIPGHVAWVSDYLPVNATFHMIAARIGDPALANAMLVGVGAWALWRIGVRLWPDHRGARVTALLLYAGSSQVLFTAMTAYAMTGYLALNLIWLACFLRGGARGHAGAIVAGFLATGLHQPLFHPLFALPFLVALLPARRWRLAALYLTSYTAIGLFWLSWPHFVTVAVAGPTQTVAGAAFVDRIAHLLLTVEPVNLWLMDMNIVRFLTWQHLFLLPLAAAGATLCWRQPLVRSLVAGIALPLVAVTILMAYQMHGWGFRYLHGVIGNACLLGGYGWIRLEGRLCSARMWATVTIATFLIVISFHGWLAMRLTEPYLAVSRQIAQIPADIVIIEDDEGPFAGDLASNRPDLTNRPLRLLASELAAEDAAALCSRYRVEFADRVVLGPTRQAIPQAEGDHRHFNALRVACAGRP